MRRKTTPCADCGEMIVGGSTGYCCHCCSKHTHKAWIKYPWTQEWDQMLREAYARCVLGKPTTAIDKLQSITRYPRYIVRLRAQRLGISRDTRKPWTGDEIEYLRANAGKKSVREISQALHRSYESARCKMQLENLKGSVSLGYSITQLADVLGVSVHQVRKFLQRGWLSVNIDHRILPHTVRAMLIAHLDSLDLRLINQHWLKNELRTVFSARAQMLRRAA